MYKSVETENSVDESDSILHTGEEKKTGELKDKTKEITHNIIQTSS